MMSDTFLIEALSFNVPILRLTGWALPDFRLPRDPFMAALGAFQGLEMEFHLLSPFHSFGLERKRSLIFLTCPP